ncbi:MAG TPA: hypothetical protein VMB52_03120 [Verrucomicrobiae bacterium]|nr:hypothetical protein [Verrucomicrobiae bacterium]
MGHSYFLGFTVFIACLVEMVEALTIVLALGITRGWKSVLIATAAALVTLAAIVGIFGRALLSISDDSSPSLRHLWLIMGALLLIFGIQWIRKAILRYSSIVATRDEDAIYEKLKKQARKATVETGDAIDWYSFTAAYKGVLLEGFEVIFIVITFGVSQNNLALGVWAALLALVVVALIGLLIHRPLSRVPENAMKLAVGILLTTFGTYFATEGLGMVWPHGDLAIWGILVFYFLVSVVLVELLKVNRELIHENP